MDRDCSQGWGLISDLKQPSCRIIGEKVAMTGGKEREGVDSRRLRVERVLTNLEKSSAERDSDRQNFRQASTYPIRTGVQHRELFCFRASSTPTIFRTLVCLGEIWAVH